MSTLHYQQKSTKTIGALGVAFGPAVCVDVGATSGVALGPAGPAICIDVGVAATGVALGLELGPEGGLELGPAINFTGFTLLLLPFLSRLVCFSVIPMRNVVDWVQFSMVKSRWTGSEIESGWTGSKVGSVEGWIGVGV
ncbi:hypothetical protein H5410_059731 [Solanum commersonii]|uniref:Uncharacterized protein n=1 Tax=Solanum commersonii TaxID=4109 RepID=A0A9J5W381_SOLCO|nr:hypothetical protein H5410_059731 [Solanum commersonii]